MDVRPSWTERRDGVAALARSIHPKLKVAAGPGFPAKQAAQAFGWYIRIPAEWSYEQACEVVPHEARHCMQQRWFGLGSSPWVGLVPFLTVYILLPLPIGLAVFRAWLEIDAERFSLSWKRKNWGRTAESQLGRIDRFGRQLWSWFYAWTVPWARWWARRALAPRGG